MSIVTFSLKNYGGLIPSFSVIGRESTPPPSPSVKFSAICSRTPAKFRQSFGNDDELMEVQHAMLNAAFPTEC